MTTALDHFAPAEGIDLSPVPDALTSVRFVHRHRLALLIGLVALAGAWAAWTYIPQIVARIAFTLIALLIANQAIAASRYRYDVRFDPVQRTWRRRMGRVPRVSEDAGSMDDVKAVVLTIVYVTTTSGGSRRRVPHWKVLIDVEGEPWSEPLIVGVTKREQEGYRLLEKYARELRVDAVDRTHDETLRRSWADLDRAVAHTGATTLPESPPAGSDITVDVEGGYRRITLGQAGGSRVGLLLQVVFGLPFAAMGAWTLAPSLARLRDGAALGDVVSADLVTLVVGSIFLLIGLRMAVRGARSVGAREWVMDGPQRLTFGLTGPLGTPRRRSLAKGEIEEVSVVTNRRHGGGATLRVMGQRVRLGSADPERAGVVRVRSDRDMVHLGLGLPPEGREWLRGALEAMLRG